MFDRLFVQQRRMLKQSTKHRNQRRDRDSTEAKTFQHAHCRSLCCAFFDTFDKRKILALGNMWLPPTTPHPLPTSSRHHESPVGPNGTLSMGPWHGQHSLALSTRRSSTQHLSRKATDLISKRSAMPTFSFKVFTQIRTWSYHFENPLPFCELLCPTAAKT